MMEPSADDWYQVDVEDEQVLHFAHDFLNRYMRAHRDPKKAHEAALDHLVRMFPKMNRLTLSRALEQVSGQRHESGMRLAILTPQIAVYVTDETTHDEDDDPNEQRKTFHVVVGDKQAGHLEAVEEAPGQWLVYDVWTEPEFRRQGIATQLMSAAREQLGQIRHADDESRTPEGDAWAVTAAPMGTQWVYINGIVEFGDQLHELARLAGQKAQLHEDEITRISNLIARGQIPQFAQVAAGTVSGGRPNIWMSTVDRNAVMSAVLEASARPGQ